MSWSCCSRSAPPGGPGPEAPAARSARSRRSTRQRPGRGGAVFASSAPGKRCTCLSRHVVTVLRAPFSVLRAPGSGLRAPGSGLRAPGSEERGDGTSRGRGGRAGTARRLRAGRVRASPARRSASSPGPSPSRGPRHLAPSVRQRTREAGARRTGRASHSGRSPRSHLPSPLGVGLVRHRASAAPGSGPLPDVYIPTRSTCCHLVGIYTSKTRRRTG